MSKSEVVGFTCDVCGRPMEACKIVPGRMVCSFSTEDERKDWLGCLYLSCSPCDEEPEDFSEDNRFEWDRDFPGMPSASEKASYREDQ